MPKPNYHQARKQKELARKSRQQEKQQRRSDRASDDKVEAIDVAAGPPPSTPGNGE